MGSSSSRDATSPAGRLRRTADPRPLGWCIVVAACLLAGGSASAAADAAADAGGLPPLVRTNHRTFAIPFRIPKPQDPDEDATTQRVVLNMSRDLGATWQVAGESSPSAGTFTYTADVDGEYWFRLRAIDRKGRSRGGEGPDIRVLVDAAGPRLAARVWKGGDGEIVCRYAAADDSLRLDSLLLEYRGSEDRGWKRVAADAVLAREKPAHLVGEAIWWAGEKIDKLVVRMTITDEAGNRTERTYSLEPGDPQVDQAALAGELGVPPLPSVGDALAADAQPAGAPPEQAGSVLARGGEPGEAWPGQPAHWNGGEPESVTRTPERTAALASTTRSAVQPGAAAGLLPRAEGGRRPVGPEDALAAAGISGSPAAGQPLEYRGRPLHLAKARRFAWDYEWPVGRRTAGPLRAELWTTRDGGLTWQRSAVDADGRSPIDVELAEPGFYGVRLELVADVPDAEAGPRTGSEPDAWVGIDEEPPRVDLLGVERDETGAEDVLVIRYAAADPLLPANAVRLLYSPNADGPWATIATGVANEGSHRWEPGRSVPSRVHLRIEAADAAGNKAFAVSEEAVSVAPTRFGGRLGGLRVLPAP